MTRQARPVARLVPETNRRQAEIDKAIANIRALRKRTDKIAAEELVPFRYEGHKN
jgi:antitoxin (DNA-binding transcriptional repressor) of toxin-antitoxin stability system